MPISDLTRTKWIIRNAPTLQARQFVLNFISNETNYCGFIMQDSIAHGLFYLDSADHTTQVYNKSSNTWTDSAYRIIEITGGTDATNETLIVWLKQNATQVPVVDLTGTKWIINETPNVDLIHDCHLDFISKGTNFELFQLDDDIVYDTVHAYSLNSNPKWANQAYRTIEIVGGTDTSYPDLLMWLAQNATQIFVTDLRGTKWIFNNIADPNYETGSGTELHCSNLIFVSNNTNFTSLHVHDNSDIDREEVSYDDALVYIIWDYGGNPNWYNQAYRTIEIIGGTDASNVTLIAWLTRNATQVPVINLNRTKWVLNADLGAYPGVKYYYLNFRSNNRTFSTLAFDGQNNTFLRYGADNIYRFGIESAGWVDAAYQIIEIKGGADASNKDLLVWLAQNAEYQELEPEPAGFKNISFGTLEIDKIAFGPLNVDKIYMGQTLVWQAGPVIDPILNNNSWTIIAQVCNAGQAENYWALGDIKIDLGTDGVTRTFRICDMQGLYNKNAVFEQVELTETAVVWNPRTTTSGDDEGCCNNYSISNMRFTELPVLFTKYSLELQNIITNTTYKVAKNGLTNSVLDLTDKLFLPAEREIFASRSSSTQTEWDALTRFALYALPENDNADFRKKFKPSSPSSADFYWERSPQSNYFDYACEVSSSGSSSADLTEHNDRIAPCFALGVPPYKIGFRGMSNSAPALTRTGQAVGATWAATSGVISIDGIDLTKIFGGYVGNDGEKLTWDSATSKYLHNGTPYTGNVFVKINRFFAKAHYEGSVLDGYDLCFAPTAPDNTYQDWFLGKDHCIIGCYKARGGNSDWATTGLPSKQGVVYTAATTANAIVTAYKFNSSTVYSLHEKWYNENAILQVLFMAIFATKQTTDVFPQDTFRHRTNDRRPTGYMDAYRAQSLFAYEPTGDSGKRGNMFLGIEDFVGWGQELVAGVVLSGTNVCPTLDYANFSYSNTYAADLVLVARMDYITELQESVNNAGLLVPKSATGGSATTYFCDYQYRGANCWYQGADRPYANDGLFSFNSSTSASYSYNYFAARLCGTPK